MDRFDRFFPQIKFFGKDLDEEISNKRVLVVGIGGIGSWIAEILARIGIKKLGILDYDKVEVHNLSRQNYTEDDIGKYKVDALERRLRSVNSNLVIRKFKKINLEYFKEFDIFFDCTDNIKTKYLLNEISVYLNMPYIFGTIAGNTGFFGYIDPKDFCLYDIYQGKEKCLTCREIGIDITSVVFIASLMVKMFIRSLREPKSEVYHFNLYNLSIEKIKVKRRDCKICIRREFDYLNNGFV